MEDTNYYDEGIFEEIKSKRILFDEPTQGIKMADILLCQMIICILIVITLFVMNYLRSDITYSVLSEVKNNMDKSFEYKSELKSIISHVLELINVKL